MSNRDFKPYPLEIKKNDRNRGFNKFKANELGS